MRVVAVDPGPHTGIAFRTAQGVPEVVMIHDDLDSVLELVHTLSPEVIVVERFATGGRMSVYGHETLEIVGMMRALAHVTGAQFIKQTPQQRRAFLVEAEEELGKGRTQHEYDSFAHLLRWEYDHMDKGKD